MLALDLSAISLSVTLPGPTRIKRARQSRLAHSSAVLYGRSEFRIIAGLLVCLRYDHDLRPCALMVPLSAPSRNPPALPSTRAQVYEYSAELEETAKEPQALDGNGVLIGGDGSPEAYCRRKDLKLGSERLNYQRATVIDLL